ncbi:MAG: hypothetical protein ACPG45_07195 [Flavobacteriaceae bacterium]
MSFEVKHTNQLLDLAVSETLYESLINQLNKDFALSNVDECISETVIPSELQKKLYSIVEGLIQNEFNSFLNLLYRIDLSEQQITKQVAQTQVAYIEQVTFLILKREWQKVWLKNKYSS